MSILTESDADIRYSQQTPGQPKVDSDQSKEQSTCFEKFISVLTWKSCLSMSAISISRFVELQQKDFFVDNFNIFFASCVLIISILLMVMECKKSVFLKHMSKITSLIFKGSFLMLIASHLFTSPRLYEQLLGLHLAVTGVLNFALALLQKSDKSRKLKSPYN